MSCSLVDICTIRVYNHTKISCLTTYWVQWELPERLYFLNHLLLSYQINSSSQISLNELELIWLASRPCLQLWCPHCCCPCNIGTSSVAARAVSGAIYVDMPLIQLKINIHFTHPSEMSLQTTSCNQWLKVQTSCQRQTASELLFQRHMIEELHFWKYANAFLL